MHCVLFWDESMDRFTIQAAFTRMANIGVKAGFPLTVQL